MVVHFYIKESEGELTMRVSKPAATRYISSSKTVDAITITNDDLNKSKTIKDVQKQIEQRTKGNKEIVVMLIEWSLNPTNNKNKD